MANNYRPGHAIETGQCKEFHTVDARLYGSKDAFKDAFACGVAVRCVKCHMHTTDIPEAGLSVFAAPPKWFLRVIRNAANELVVIDTPRRS